MWTDFQNSLHYYEGYDKKSSVLLFETQCIYFQHGVFYLLYFIHSVLFYFTECFGDDNGDDLCLY